MTPQTDAARVGIDGFLNALDPRVDTIVTLQRADRSIPLKASHLRLVLAALDEHETPPAPPAPEHESETCGKRSTWQRWGGILGPCVKPPGHETDEWHFDARGCAWDPAIDATQGAAR